MSAKSQTIWVACDPAFFDGATQFPISVPRKPVVDIKPKPISPGPVWTIGKEVDEALQTWYAALGTGVPADEVGIGAVIDAASAAETQAMMDSYERAEEELPSVVPPFGTPEFWDYHRKKKALENKKRAEAGLPPLPTKKELEAEKEKKRAAKAAAKAAKDVAAITDGVAKMKM